MFLRRLWQVVFLRRLLDGVKTSALGEALSSAAWAATADKASVVEWPGENRISPTPLAGVQPKLIFVAASHQTGLDTRSMTRRSTIVGILGEGTNRGSNPAGLSWSSAHLMQRGPDEPSWSWTKVSMMQLTHPKVAQSKLEALRP